MAIKKKVTYSVSYVEGTDTLTTKLSSLLQDIVTLILSQNPGLTVLDTITVGSERFTGAPLYDTYNSGLYVYDYGYNRHYQSDVYFLGTNEDNVCLSLGFYDGALVIAMNMTPKVEKMHTDVWSSRYGLSTVPLYATGKASRWFGVLDALAGNYALPYSVINNTISIGIIYWSTEYSRGYTFCTSGGQNDGVDLVIFPTDEGNNLTGLGAVIWPYGTVAPYHNGLTSTVCAFSFSENLADNMVEVMMMDPTSPYSYVPSGEQMQMLNARYDWRCWASPQNGSDYHRKGKLFAAMHTMTSADGKMDYYMQYIIETIQVNATGDVPSPDKFLSPLCLGYNLPHLTPGQAYVRKMRIPGWNPSCKGELYLLWSPVTSLYQSGDIVEVGSKSYAIITTGAVVWAARVS